MNHEHKTPKEVAVRGAIEVFTLFDEKGTKWLFIIFLIFSSKFFLLIVLGTLGLVKKYPSYEPYIPAIIKRNRSGIHPKLTSKKESDFIYC